jgi:hypothetical protein
MTDLAQLLPDLMKLVEQTYEVDSLKGMSVKEVMADLAEQTDKTNQPLIAKAQTALASLPLINDLPFEEVYLRVSTKKA